MQRIASRTFSFAAPLALMAFPALAELTPSEVWNDWRAGIVGAGYTFTATEEPNGDDLTVRDVRITFPMPEEGGTFVLDLGTINLTRNSDGSVSIGMADVLPMTITGLEDAFDGQEFTVVMNYTQSGQEMTASGSADAITYAYQAASVSVNMAELSSGGIALPESIARVNVAASNVTSTNTITTGDLRDYVQSGALENLTVDVFFQDPDDPTIGASIKAELSGMSIDGKGALPLEVSPGSDMSEMIAAGFAGGGNITYTGGSSDWDIKDPQDGNFKMTTQSAGGKIAVQMGAEGLSYDVSQTNLQATVTPQGLPFPFEVAMSESGIKLAMPVVQSDTPQDFAMGVTLRDFTMSDLIWGMFDPGAQLPRDPATLLLDLTGKVKLLVDWMDPDAAAQMTGMPGEMEAVTLNALLVDAAGAKLDGTGALTFDGQAPAMVPGLGSPVGAVNLNLAGANGLIDKLVAMGFLPQDQAMGARMMMGLFAIPGEGPDTLKSKIEFTTDGQILANGQRIR